jgi:hypothetical protein
MGKQTLNLGNALRLNWSNIKDPVLLHPPITESIEEISRRKDSYLPASWKAQVWSDLLEK